MFVCVCIPLSPRPSLSLQWYGFGGLRNVSFSIDTLVSAKRIFNGKSMIFALDAL